MNNKKETFLYTLIRVLMMEAYEAGMYGEFAPMKDKERPDLDPWQPTKDYIKARIESMFDAAGMKDLLYKDSIHDCLTCASKRYCPKLPKCGELSRINCFAWEETIPA